MCLVTFGHEDGSFPIYIGHAHTHACVPTYACMRAHTHMRARTHTITGEVGLDNRFLLSDFLVPILNTFFFLLYLA